MNFHVSTLYYTLCHCKHCKHSSFQDDHLDFAVHVIRLFFSPRPPAATVLCHPPWASRSAGARWVSPRWPERTWQNAKRLIGRNPSNIPLCEITMEKPHKKMKGGAQWKFWFRLSLGRLGTTLWDPRVRINLSNDWVSRGRLVAVNWSELLQ